MKKVTTFLLLLALLTSIGCGSTPSSNGDLTADHSDSTDTTDNYDDELPEFDFGGADFIVDCRPMNENSWINSTIDVESQNGDNLNDAIYKRNRELEDRFNFNFVVQHAEGNRRDAAYNSIMAEDNDFDVFMLTDRNALEMAQDGLLVAYDNLEYINLDKPYWSQTMNESISVCGHFYFSYGDFNLIPYDYTHMLVFNTKLIDDYQLDNPIQLVKDGTWTFDAFNKMASACTVDLDGDNDMDENDLWGFQAISKQVLPGFWIGAGVLSMDKNENDEPVLTCASDENFWNVIEKIFNITYDNGCYYLNTSTSNANNVSQDMFVNNKGLFLDTTFKLITNLRDMSVDFGIIPYPKLDEKQDSYYSRVEGGDFAMVPITNQKLEMTGVILEAMSAASAKTVIPEYYEKMLKGKVSRDNESGEMLDIIYSNRVYDLGDTFYNPYLRDGIMLTMFNENDRNYASKIAGVKNEAEAAIKKTVDAFKALS